jgi:hypothetical protein
LFGLPQSLVFYILFGGSFLESNMTNIFLGASLGIMFAVLVMFTFKENTVIYKDGYIAGVTTCEVTK